MPGERPPAADDDGESAVTSDASGRGQTAQDFALGMTVFLLTAAFVFAFLPALTVGSDPGPGVGAESAAQRASGTLLADLDDGGGAALDATATATFFSSPGDPGPALGLDDRYSANVTVLDAASGEPVTISPGGSPVRLATGPAAADRVTATHRRLVRVPGAAACDPTCHLVVHVW